MGSCHTDVTTMTNWPGDIKGRLSEDSKFVPEIVGIACNVMCRCARWTMTCDLKMYSRTPCDIPLVYMQRMYISVKLCNFVDRIECRCTWVFGCTKFTSWPSHACQPKTMSSDTSNTEPPSSLRESMIIGTQTASSQSKRQLSLVGMKPEQLDPVSAYQSITRSSNTPGKLDSAALLYGYTVPLLLGKLDFECASARLFKLQNPRENH